MFKVANRCVAHKSNSSGLHVVEILCMSIDLNYYLEEDLLLCASDGETL